MIFLQAGSTASCDVITPVTEEQMKTYKREYVIMQLSLPFYPLSNVVVRVAKYYQPPSKPEIYGLTLPHFNTM